MADHSKWGIIGLSTIATLDQVDVLVTDAELDAVAQRMVSEQVGQLIVAARSDDDLDHGPRTVAAPMTERPGEFARVRRTSTTLADGRELIYFDDSEPYRSGARAATWPTSARWVLARRPGRYVWTR